MAWSLPHSDALEAARDVAQALRDGGFLALFAGGAVRDLLLDLPAKDFDVATSALPDEVLALATARGWKSFAVGAHFGVVLVQVHGVAIEVATFRHDGVYTDGRRPDAVRFSADPREDVLRRDFTINGMLLDSSAMTADPSHAGRVLVPASALLDSVNGRADLDAGIVRTIGSPDQRFAEDKLRMLRGVRFAARLGFTIDPATLAAIERHAAAIDQVSHERVRDELTRMLTEGHARRAFELLDRSGLLPHVLPEVARLQGVEQPPQYHPEGDVWVHTLMLLERLPAGSPPALAWGFLLHDIGKPATFQPPDPARPGDRIRFNGHVEAGMRVAEVLLNQLRFSNDDKEQVLALIQHHMRFGDLRAMKGSTLKRFIRLPHFDQHLALHKADCESSHGDLRLWQFATEAWQHDEPAAARPSLLVTGRDLIAAGYSPGTAFKQMLALAEDAQLEGRIHTTEAGLELIRQQLDAAASKTPEHDVLVVGAGMAGLTAARALAEAGLRVTVVEATGRVGGRIHTRRDGGTVVELGAEFIHGRPPDLWALIEEAGLATYERTGDFVGSDDDTIDETLDTLEPGNNTEPDRSFAEHVETLDLSPDARAAEISYVEGFNAADAREASIVALGVQQQAEDAIEGDRSWRVTDGYDRLPDFLRDRFLGAGGTLVLDADVATVAWSRGRATLTCHDGRTFTGRACVVSLPLGVVQSGSVTFSPDIPAVHAAAARMRIGHVCRFTMLFAKRLWSESLSFLIAPGRLPGVWWTAHPHEQQSLTGWVGGPRSAALRALPADALREHAIIAAAEALHVEPAEVRAQLTGFHTYDWSSDPHARGAYSWVPVGGVDASAALCVPIEDTLYFAGEHTDTTGHWGTVHAAVRSGTRAARQILDETKTTTSAS